MSDIPNKDLEGDIDPKDARAVADLIYKTFEEWATSVDDGSDEKRLRDLIRKGKKKKPASDRKIFQP